MFPPSAPCLVGLRVPWGFKLFFFISVPSNQQKVSRLDVKYVCFKWIKSCHLIDPFKCYFHVEVRPFPVSGGHLHSFKFPEFLTFNLSIMISIMLFLVLCYNYLNIYLIIATVTRPFQRQRESKKQTQTQDHTLGEHGLCLIFKNLSCGS